MTSLLYAVHPPTPSPSVWDIPLFCNATKNDIIIVFFHKSQRPSFHASLFLPAQQCYLRVAAFVTQVVAVEAFPDAHSCLPALAAGINHISPSLMFAPYRAACACLLFLSQ